MYYIHTTIVECVQNGPLDGRARSRREGAPKPAPRLPPALAPPAVGFRVYA